MFCETCLYSNNGFCAVNPTHIKGMWSEACNEYAHDRSKEIICGNCSAFSHNNKCLINHSSPDTSSKGCMDFYSQEEIDAAHEWNDREQWQYVISNIKVKLLYENGKFQMEFLK